MHGFFRWSSSSATVLSLAIASTITPMVLWAPTTAQMTPPTPAPTAPVPTLEPTTKVDFSDVGKDFWAQPFIEALAARNIITGFPDETFRPDEPVARSEFAAMVANAFDQNQVRPLAETGFRDVPPNYWAEPAIEEAFQTGFMVGYGGGLFLPEQPVTKAQAIVALASGLGLSPNGDVGTVLGEYYIDAERVPDYAVSPTAAATQANIVVNYPNLRVLNPTGVLTRAEAAALIYQALVSQGRLEPLPSDAPAANYIVASQAAPMPGSTSTTAEDLESQPTQDTSSDSEVGQADIEVETEETTGRGVFSYIGIGGNFGLTGDTALGNGSFALYTKIGVFRNFSFRPALMLASDPVLLLPITYDLNLGDVDVLDEDFSIVPFLGLGAALQFDDFNAGFLLTGGLDVPINDRFTATATVNAAFLEETDVGLMLGIGYNFASF